MCNSAQRDTLPQGLRQLINDPIDIVAHGQGIATFFQLRELLVQLLGPVPATLPQIVSICLRELRLLRQQQCCTALAELVNPPSHADRIRGPLVEPLLGRISQVVQIGCAVMAVSKHRVSPSPRRPWTEEPEAAATAIARRP